MLYIFGLQKIYHMKNVTPMQEVHNLNKIFALLLFNISD